MVKINKKLSLCSPDRITLRTEKSWSSSPPTTYLIEGCSYCNSQISIEYDIRCLEKSITYWSNKLSKQSEKCQGNEWDSSYEMLIYPKKQQDYLKQELVKLKAIYDI